MNTITLEAKARETGKKPTKKVRHEDSVPCVLYAKGVEPIHFQVTQLDLRPLIYTHESHKVDVKMDGDSWSCIVRHIDFHPVTDQPIHADFLMLREGEMVRLSVPLRFLGTSIGVTRGGSEEHVISHLQIRCLPKDIPAFVDVEVTELDFGDTLRIRDLSMEGVTFLDRPEQTIVMVAAPKRGGIDEEGEEGEEGEGEEGEEEGETEEEG